MLMGIATVIEISSLIVVSITSGAIRIVAVVLESNVKVMDKLQIKDVIESAITDSLNAYSVVMPFFVGYIVATNDSAFIIEKSTAVSSTSKCIEIGQKMTRILMILLYFQAYLLDLHSCSFVDRGQDSPY